MLNELIVLCAAIGILWGCGKAEDGRDGNSPVCKVVTKAEKKKFLVCLNDDGTTSETEILPGENGSNGENGNGTNGQNGRDGRDGKDALVSQTICRGSVAGSNVAFDTLKLSNGSSVVMFKSDYISSGGLEFSDAMSGLVKASEPVAIDSKLWNAELVSATEAKITRKTPLTVQKISCATE